MEIYVRPTIKQMNTARKEDNSSFENLRKQSQVVATRINDLHHSLIQPITAAYFIDILYEYPLAEVKYATKVQDAELLRALGPYYTVRIRSSVPDAIYNLIQTKMTSMGIHSSFAALEKVSLS
jgi:hypothetical protein